jgi:hypothetical protein
LIFFTLSRKTAQKRAKLESHPRGRGVGGMARDLGAADPTLQVRSGEVRAHRGGNPRRRLLFTATSRCQLTPDLFTIS